MVRSNHSNLTFFIISITMDIKKTVTFKGLEVQTQFQAFSEYISRLQ